MMYTPRDLGNQRTQRPSGELAALTEAFTPEQVEDMRVHGFCVEKVFADGRVERIDPASMFKPAEEAAQVGAKPEVKSTAAERQKRYRERLRQAKTEGAEF